MPGYVLSGHGRGHPSDALPDGKGTLVAAGHAAGRCRLGLLDLGLLHLGLGLLYLRLRLGGSRADYVGDVRADQCPGEGDGPHVELFFVGGAVEAVAAGGRDADQFTTLVDRCPAGVATGDLRIRLDPLTAAGQHVLSDPAAHDALGESDRRARNAWVTDNGQAIAGQEVVTVTDRHGREGDAGRNWRLIGVLGDLQDRQVEQRVPRYVLRPVRHLRRQVGAADIGHEDGVPVVMRPCIQVADHVVVGEDVTVGADDGARAGPGNEFTPAVVPGDHLDGCRDQLGADVAGQHLCGGAASGDEQRQQQHQAAISPACGPNCNVIAHFEKPPGHQALECEPHQGL